MRAKMLLRLVKIDTLGQKPGDRVIEEPGSGQYPEHVTEDRGASGPNILIDPHRALRHDKVRVGGSTPTVVVLCCSVVVMLVIFQQWRVI